MYMYINLNILISPTITWHGQYNHEETSSKVSVFYGIMQHLSIVCYSEAAVNELSLKLLLEQGV